MAPELPRARAAPFGWVRTRPLWIDDQNSPRLDWIVGRGQLQPRWRLPGGDAAKLSRRKRTPYAAGIYHYAPRRSGSVADRRNSVCVSEQDRAAGAEADGLLGPGVG